MTGHSQMTTIQHILPAIDIREVGGETPKKPKAKGGKRTIPFSEVCAMREAYRTENIATISSIAERFRHSYEYTRCILSNEARIKE